MPRKGTDATGDSLRSLFAGRLKKARRIHLGELPAVPAPQTQVGGAPWWPLGKSRPLCVEGHEMAFMAQVLLRDVPGLARAGGLLSFHYCVKCQEQGRMSFGAGDRVNRGYSVDCLPNTALPIDGLEPAEPSPLPAHRITFSDVEEIPAMEDLPEAIIEKLPSDFPSANDDFDECVWPGLVHVARSKLGGWPHWQQSGEWPACKHGRRMDFVAQLDWELGQDAAWAAGGYAYLFICAVSCPTPSGDLVIQTT